jgi:tRNA/rRNA methyltransferase
MTLPETSTSDCNGDVSAVPGAALSRLPPLRFVLVETSRPGNIGAAARAMKTMGFSELVLVRPRFADAATQDEAVAFASGAQDVLTAARIVETIEEALEGCNFAAAVSARLREFSPPVVTPREVAGHIAGRADCRAALVFGNERFGLPNEIVEKCNVLINIPANPAYSSLNLAQAVQILAYECSLAAAGGGAAGLATDAGAPGVGAVGFQGEPAGLAQIDAMFVHLEQALVAVEFLDPENPKKLMARLRRLFSRTQLEVEEVNILRGIARQVLKMRKS